MSAETHVPLTVDSGTLHMSETRVLASGTIKLHPGMTAKTWDLGMDSGTLHMSETWAYLCIGIIFHFTPSSVLSLLLLLSSFLSLSLAFVYVVCVIVCPADSCYPFQ